jgi:TonB family protein
MQGLGLEPTRDTVRRAGPVERDAPLFLIEPEPWHRVFFRNLADWLWPRRPPALYLSSAPGEFWPDVFVRRPLPWSRFVQSACYHGTLAITVVALSRYWPQRPDVVERPAFNQADVIYYSPSEYLPPLDSGGKRLQLPQKGDPVYAPQPIISVPAEPDNRRETIVTPPDIRLKEDVSLPNIVAWSETPQPQIPLAATAGARDRRLPAMPATEIVAPPPELSKVTAKGRLRLEETVIAPLPDVREARSGGALPGPQASVVAPPPLVQAASIRRLGDMNIGRSAVVAPAPQLPLEAQRTASRTGSVGAWGAASVVPPSPAMQGGEGSFSRGATVAGGLGSSRVVPPSPTVRGSEGSFRRGGAVAGGWGSARVVPPPPSVQGGGGGARHGGGQLIALSIHPAPPTGPVEVPAGNRRGTFAAASQGKAGAAGSPEIAANVRAGVGAPSAGGSRAGAGNIGVPAGIYVGAADPSRRSSGTAGNGGGNGTGTGNSNSSSGSTLVANATPPRVNSNARRAVEVNSPTPVEQQVFGGRRFYSMSLNMPNLNSAGGSWVFHFAEMETAAETKGDLMAPEILQKVDPAYPLELMRRNVQGTVTLYAVIHSDGRVGEVKVLQGVDDQLDSYAQTALSQWRFTPATKNGKAVALEAVVMIPFRAGRGRTGF